MAAKFQMAIRKLKKVSCQRYQMLTVNIFTPQFENIQLHLHNTTVIEQDGKITIISKSSDAIESPYTENLLPH